MAAPGPSKEPEKAAQAPTARPAESDAGAAQRARLADRARALATVSHSIVDQTPRDHEDAAVVVRHTGSEPEAILRWVRENTRHLAYRGLLRGAPGVLMDRSGNSLDRALFTADLLKRAGHVVRLARTTLGRQAASGLRTALAARTQGADPLPPLDRAEAARTFAAVPLPPGRLDQAIVATVRRDEAFGSTVQDLLSKVLPALSASLGALEKRDADLVAEAEDALTDHFWVQRQAGGNWEDLDPDADTVGRLAATSTLDPDQVPDDLKHRVTFRILFESRQAGTVSEKPVFERSWAAGELVGKSFVLQHRLLPEPRRDSSLASSDPAAAHVQALKSAWVIEPVLTLGSEELTDRLYTLRAEVFPANRATKSQLGFADSAVAAVGAKMGGGFTQPFGGPAPIEAPKAPDESVGPRITAEWLEIEVRVPGRPVEQHRRAVFDLLEPSARAAGGSQAPKIDDAAREKRGLALAGETAALVSGCTPSQDWLTRLSGQRLASALEQVASFVSAPRRPAESFQLLGEQSVPFPLWSWALSRSRNAALSPAPPIAPNIALLWSMPARPRGAGWTASIAFDIVTNRTGADFSFSHRVAQGVLDTATEHALFPGPGDRSNTAAQHAMDLASGRPWVRLAPGDIAGVAQLELSPEAKARIREDLKRGYLVIARPRTSEEARSASWWRVDPVTGATLGIGEHGLGADVPEEGVIDHTVHRLGVCAFLLLASIAVEAHEGITPGGVAAAGIGAAFCGTGAVLHHTASFIAGSAIELVVEMLATMKEPGGE